MSDTSRLRALDKQEQLKRGLIKKAYECNVKHDVDDYVCARLKRRALAVAPDSCLASN